MILSYCHGTSMGALETSSPRSSSQMVCDRSFSIGRTSMGDSVRRIGSGNLSLTGSNSISEEILDEVFAQVGDVGDRVVDDGSRCIRQNLPSSNLIFGENTDTGTVDDVSVRLDHFRVHPHDHPFSEAGTALPADAILYSRDHNLSKSSMKIVRSLSMEEKKFVLPRAVDYLSYLILLAVFGVLGAMTRYIFQKFFGPHTLAFTNDQTSFYLDLPSNMVGSFLMGFLGVVFKGDIVHISDHLAVGLTTGYLGSLTTFSGWNQKMVELSSQDRWVFAIAGILLGMFLVNESINVGVESAGWLRKCILSKLGREPDEFCSPNNWRIDNPSRHIAMLLVFMLILTSLWAVSGVLAAADLRNVSSRATLWLGCLVGPLGVWTRWFLARLNGMGVGRKKNMLKWLPIGTLLANVLAACIMAALATISKAVNTEKSSIILGGMQFGLLGCMSTVSTFAAEVYAMRQSRHPGRALAYSASTLIPSFAAAMLIYSLPVWKKHYA